MLLQMFESKRVTLRWGSAIPEFYYPLSYFDALIGRIVCSPRRINFEYKPKNNNVMVSRFTARSRMQRESPYGCLGSPDIFEFLQQFAFFVVVLSVQRSDLLNGGHLSVGDRERTFAVAATHSSSFSNWTSSIRFNFCCKECLYFLCNLTVFWMNLVSFCLY